jgi:hypothetical protein
MKYVIELSDEQVAGVTFAMSRANENKETLFADEQEYIQSVMTSAAEGWAKSSPVGVKDELIAKLKEVSADDAVMSAKLAAL